MLRLLSDDGEDGNADGDENIDRDADVFKMVISYLRNGKRIHAIADESLKERFEMELDYWNLDEE